MKQAKQRKYKFTYCGSCERSMRFVYKARQRTYYPDDESNYFYGCKDCHKCNDEYWNSMWAEYYNSVL